MKKRTSRLLFTALTIGAMTTIAACDGGKDPIIESVKVDFSVKTGAFKDFKVFSDKECKNEITDGKVEEKATVYVSFELTGEDDVVESVNFTSGSADKAIQTKNEGLVYVYKITNVKANCEIEIVTKTVEYVKHDVTFKNADGTVLEVKKAIDGRGVKKPADPTAPSGKKFYGWMNAKNGGQIWNFEREDLNFVLEDIELVPCFVDANVNAQILEAELCPEIPDMNGATYSGGAKGLQLIRSDENYEYGSTCDIEKFSYYKDDKRKPSVITSTNPLPDGKEKFEMDPKADKCGYFVHFMYIKNDELTFKVISDKEATNVSIFASFSAEYGIIDEGKTDRYCKFSQTSFPICVNGAPMEYGNVTMHNIPSIGDFLYFQDYLISSNVTLRAGENIISMKVDNEDTLNGTIASTAPCIDSIKVFSSSTLRWDEKLLTNIVKTN